MSKTRVLITGATGFAGRHLAEALPASKYTVFGMCYPQPPRDSEKHLAYLDLRSERDVYDAVRSVQPEWVFHLAAVSNVGQSWSRRKEVMETNVMGTFYLLEAVKKYAPGARVLFVSSSDVYGDRPAGEGGAPKPGLPLGDGRVRSGHVEPTGPWRPDHAACGALQCATGR